VNIYQLADSFRRLLLANERQAATAMVREYGRVWKRMQLQIHDLYQEMYRSGLSDNLTYRLMRIDELRVQVEAEIGRFAQYAEGEIVGQQRQAVTDALSHSEILVRAQLPEVMIGWVRLPVDAMENLVGVLQDGSPLADLLAELGPEAAQLVSDGLVQGMALGLGAAEIAREIRAGLGGNLVRALRIARTETLRAYREASRAAYQANNDLVAGWIWRSGRNRRTCAACWAMDGTFHTLDEMLDGHPNCRCYMVPVVRGVLSRTLRKNGIEAFNDLGQADQLAVLGPAKFAAWQDGAISLTDLVGRRFDARWGSMRYEKSLSDILGKRTARKFYSKPGTFKLETVALPREPRKVILKYEKQIFGNRFESAYVVNMQGQTLLYKKGEQYSVSFNEDELKLMQGSILTHNHPRGWEYMEWDPRRQGNSFSPDDIFLAHKAQLGEMRAVTPVWRYSMKPPPGGWDLDLYFNKVGPAFREAEAYVHRRFLRLVNNGKMISAEAEARHFHEIWKRVAKKTGLVYNRVKWKP